MRGLGLDLKHGEERYAKVFEVVLRGLHLFEKGHGQDRKDTAEDEQHNKGVGNRNYRRNH